MHCVLGQYWKTRVIALVLGILLGDPSTAQARSFHFDIPSQSLSQALQRYGQISGQQIVFTETLVGGLVSTPLKGEFTAEAALKRLLHSSGLIAERSSSGVFMIQRLEPEITSPQRHHHTHSEGSK